MRVCAPTYLYARVSVGPTRTDSAHARRRPPTDAGTDKSTNIHIQSTAYAAQPHGHSPSGRSEPRAVRKGFGWVGNQKNELDTVKDGVLEISL